MIFWANINFLKPNFNPIIKFTINNNLNDNCIVNENCIVDNNIPDSTVNYSTVNDFNESCTQNISCDNNIVEPNSIPLLILLKVFYVIFL